jgi:hypothetical protein
MPRPKVANEEDGLKIWKVAANIAYKGWPSIFGVGRDVKK